MKVEMPPYNQGFDWNFLKKKKKKRHSKSSMLPKFDFFSQITFFWDLLYTDILGKSIQQMLCENQMKLIFFWQHKRLFDNVLKEWLF